MDVSCFDLIFCIKKQTPSEPRKTTLFLFFSFNFG